MQAAIALEGLRLLDEWTASTRAHARVVNDALAGVPGVQVPVVPEGRTHAYYQYCVYTPDRDNVVARSIRRGVDIETLHVDVCPELPLFADLDPAPAPGASRSEEVVQIPVYASLTTRQIQRVARVVRRAVLRQERDR